MPKQQYPSFRHIDSYISCNCVVVFYKGVKSWLDCADDIRFCFLDVFLSTYVNQLNLWEISTLIHCQSHLQSQADLNLVDRFLSQDLVCRKSVLVWVSIFLKLSHANGDQLTSPANIDRFCLNKRWLARACKKTCKTVNVSSALCHYDRLLNREFLKHQSSLPFQVWGIRWICQS